MAEDENVDAFSMTKELAERLGVTDPSSVKNDEKTGHAASSCIPSSSNDATFPHNHPRTVSNPSMVLHSPSFSPFLHLLYEDDFDVAPEVQLEFYEALLETGYKLSALASLDRIECAYEALLYMNAQLPSDPLEKAAISKDPKDSYTAAEALTIFSGAAMRYSSTRSVDTLIAALQDVGSIIDGEDDIIVIEPEKESISRFASPDGLYALACAAGFVKLTTILLKIRGPTFRKHCDSTPLIEACASGSFRTVQKFVEAGIDLNVLSRAKNTALIYTAATGHAKCARLLLESGRCDMSLLSGAGHCPLMEAARSWRVMQLLIDHGAKQRFFTLNSDIKEGPLTLAAYKGHESAVKYLLGLGLNTEEELRVAITEASMDGHAAVARALLEHGSPVNITSDSYESPLTLACSGGHDDLVKLLLQAGAYIEEPNDESYTPLMEAAREGHLAVVQVLIDHGACINAQTEETGETALTVAACGGYTDVLDLLVRTGGDLELGANTPLMEAAQEGHVGTVLYILSAARLDEVLCPNIQQHLNAALSMAADSGHLEVVEVLFSEGAHINMEYEGRTPLMKAAKNGNTDIVSFFIGKGVDINLKAQPGNDATALSLACTTGYKEVVRLLLEAGADPNIELKDGVTCILEAAKNGFVEIVELLLDYGIAFSTSTVSASAKPIDAVSLPDSSLNDLSSGSCPTPNRRKQSFSSHLPNYLPPGMLPENPQNDPAFTDAEWAKVYYGWLAALYNLRHSGHSTNDRIPLGYDYGMVQPNLDVHTQLTIEQVQALANYVATLPVPIGPSLEKSLHSPFSPNNDLLDLDHVENSSFISRVMNKLTRDKKSSNISFSTSTTSTKPAPLNATNLNVIGMNDSPNNQGSFTSSHEVQVELDKSTSSSVNSSFPVSKSQTVASCSEVLCIPQPASIKTVSIESKDYCEPVRNSSFDYFDTLNELGGKREVSPAQAIAVDVDESLGEINEPILTGVNNGSDDYGKLDIVSSTLTPSSADSLLNTWTEAKWGSALHQFTSPIPPDQRRLIRKRFQEYLALDSHNTNSLKHFVDIYHEWCKSVSVKECDKTNDALSICEIMKLIRPSAQDSSADVESIGPSTDTSSKISLNGSSVTPGTGIHRRTLSEGDDIEYRRPIKTIFNVDKTTESNNDTPLTLACSNGHKDMVNILVARGANIEHRDKKGFTPLILAATGGHVGVVHALLTAGANIEAQSERTKDTALSLACSGGRKEVVEVLLAHGANKEHRNVSDYTPLSLAASGGYVDIVNMLLNAGAEINSRTGSKLGISPLMLAAMNGHKEATRVLLEKGSDINAQIETNRNTALTLACFQGRTDVVRLLLQHNANVEHRAKTGLTPLMEAANGGYVEVGVLLLEHNADPNTTPVPSSRDTALTIAADKGHDKFVEMLITKGSAIDAKNKKGCTALWLACHGGHLDTVKILVAFGAHVDTQDNRRVSALLISFRKGHLKVVDYMVKYVKQFPNHQEMFRYLTTLTAGDQKVTKDLQDLLCNVQKCITVIVAATKAQAEQANRAAESLLALLAEEEEMAKNKKQKKQKKKEEKRAKKKKNEDKDIKIKVLKDDVSQKNQISKEYSEPESEDESNKVLESESIDSNSFHQSELAKESLIQSHEQESDVNTSDINPHEESTASSLEAVLNNKTKRQHGRKVKVLETKNPLLNEAIIPIKPNLPVPAAILLTNVKTSPSTDEWVKASKKKQSKLKTSSVLTPAPPVLPATLCAKEYHLDDAFVWKDADAARRSKSNTLCVGSSVIARVIGRGGFNINAIREATGASIEVEKQGIKKEQHDRHIFIKGTQDIVRNATQMINGLIADNDASVTDIIRQVLRGNSSVASSSSESGSKVDAKQPFASAGTTRSSQARTTTNIWQQRMAARQQQETNQEPALSPPNVKKDINLISSSSINKSRQEADFILKLEAVGIRTKVENPDITSASSPTNVSSKNSEGSISKCIVRPLSPKEEDLMKAPGYRPHIISEKAMNNKVESSKTPIMPTFLEKEDAAKTTLNLDAASFLDETTSAKLAQIWGAGSTPSNSEPAWDSQILLNNLSLNLDNSRSDWQVSNEQDFLGMNFQPSSAKKQSVNSAAPPSSNTEWAAPGNKTNLPSRSQCRSAVLQNSPQAPPSLSTQAARSFSGNQQNENSVLFNQLAVQLLTHQGSSSTSTSPYFSYTDSTASLKSVSSIPTQAPKTFNSYQNASQEYENLHNLLNSSYPSHGLSNRSCSDFNSQQTYGASTIARTIMPSRTTVPFIPPPPPPGFGAVVPPPSGNIGTNTSVPPPPIRNSFFNNQVPPPSHTSAFMYNSQQASGNWNQSMPPTNVPPQQMHWNGWK
ncbi:unnamed protein product [Auanema sp. JU1783]|nr:unnamed protein product [Auanema sp. JU1783]